MIISRAEAKSSGLKWYFTGKPCKHGHVAERQTVNGRCRECGVVDRRANAEAYNKKARAKYHTDEAKERRHNNKDRKNEVRRACYHRDPEKKRAYLRELYKRTPDIWKHHARKRKMRIREADGTYTISDIKLIREAQKDKCGYCRINLNGGGHIDHIIPLIKGGTNYPRNLQLLCVTCNCSKKATDPIDYARKHGKLL